MATQCKDIPDRPILAFLRDMADAPYLGCGWHDLEGDGYSPSVRRAIPSGLPDRLVLAKMRMLIRRGLVDGCGCGCRGDFTLTEKGRAWLDGGADGEGKP